MMALVDQLSVAASDFTVNATVPAPMPDGAPSITGPQINDMPYAAEKVITGTCPVITPSVIIAVYDNGVLIGSSVCGADGTFSLPVSLDYGTHVLVATIFTITGERGESSTEVTITRLSPMTPVVSASSAGSQSEPSVLAPPELSGVIGVVPTSPFAGFDTSGEVTWRAKFVGGEPPYKVQIDWGDKTIDSHTIPDHEEHVFTHRYKVAKAYSVVVNVTDAKGWKATYRTVAVAQFVSRLTAYDNSAQPSPAMSFLQKYMWHIYIITFFGLVFLWYLEHGHKAVKRVAKKRKRVQHGHH